MTDAGHLFDDDEGLGYGVVAADVKAESPETDLRRQLRLMHGALRPGEGFQLQAMDLGGGHPSGVFDNCDMAADEAMRASANGASCIRLMLNPTAFKDGRPKNKITPGLATKDLEVTRRTSFMVDFDPADNEGAEAIELVADGCADDLSEQYGWPQPMMVMSGRGVHLIYACDLANNDASRDLVHKCLEAVAEKPFGHGIEIDTMVFPAGRHTKAVGTLARKPGRDAMAVRLLRCPSQLTPVSHEALELLAAKAPPWVTPSAYRRHDLDAPDIASFPRQEKIRLFEKYGAETGPSVSGKHGRDQFWLMALKAQGLGMDDQTALSAMRWYNDLYAEPRWPDHGSAGIHRILSQAGESSQVTFGSHIPTSGSAMARREIVRQAESMAKVIDITSKVAQPDTIDAEYCESRSPVVIDEVTRRLFKKLDVNIDDVINAGIIYVQSKDKTTGFDCLPPLTANLRAWLRFNTQLRGNLRLNQMGHVPEFNGHRLTDTDVNKIKNLAEGRWKQDVAKERIRDAIDLVCDDNAYDPIIEYVSSLPAWDGVERWKQLPEQVLGVTSNIVHAAMVMEKFGIAAMARGMAGAHEDGCKVDNMLILHSKAQGWKKSSFARTIFGGGRMFSEQPLDIHSSDSLRLLSRHWGFEIGEAEILASPAKVNALKAFVSTQVDEVRTPYDKYHMRLPRRCVFIATTNEDKFLHDTSNRRYWVIAVGSRAKIPLLRSWVPQLWAEAKVKYDQHMAQVASGIDPDDCIHKWWLTADEDEANEENNSHRQHEDIWTTDVLTFLEKQGRTPFLPVDVLSHLGMPTDKRNREASNRIIKIITMLKCDKYCNGENKRINGKVGKWWIPPAELPTENDDI